MDRLGADGEGGASAGVPPSNVKESVTVSFTAAVLRSSEAVNVAASAADAAPLIANKDKSTLPIPPLR